MNNTHFKEWETKTVCRVNNNKSNSSSSYNDNDKNKLCKNKIIIYRIHTLLLSSMSALLPTKILFTLSDACCSMLRIQFLMSGQFENQWWKNLNQALRETKHEEEGRERKRAYYWKKTRRWHHKQVKCPLPLCSKLLKKRYQEINCCRSLKRKLMNYFTLIFKANKYQK